MNRRTLFRNAAYSVALVALSACKLRIENPLLRLGDEMFPSHQYKYYMHARIAYMEDMDHG